MYMDVNTNVFALRTLKPNERIVGQILYSFDKVDKENMFLPCFFVRVLYECVRKNAFRTKS